MKSHSFHILVLPLLLFAAPTLPAQEVLNWGDFELCNDCELEVTELVRLGDADGSGIIEDGSPLVVWNEELGYLYFPLGGTWIKIFDHEGPFIREIGGEGDGPGEFRSIIDVEVVDGRIAVLDGAKRAVVILSPAGEYLAQHSYEFVPGRIASAGPGRIVVTSTNTWSRDIDQPLHLMDLSSGATTLEFGAANAGAEKTDADRRFAGMLRGSALSRVGTVWWGSIRTPAVQEWSLEGELVRDFDGELPWFPELGDWPDLAKEPPGTLLEGLALDQEDRLWMLVVTADAAWDEVELGVAHDEAVVPTGSGDDAEDSRLDIFDLRERRHLGRYVWDESSGVMLDRGGAPAVAVLEYSDAMVPQIVVYGVRAGGR